jgi:3-oxoacyl-[acyl-carrier-protein] synthase-1
MAEALYVTCLSLVCPVGLTPASAAAAMRARISAFEELTYVDNNGEPIVGAAVPSLAQGLVGRPRLVGLLALAVEKSRALLPEALMADPLPILLCTREAERPGGRLQGVLGEVYSRLHLQYRREGSVHIAAGPTAVFEALAHARRACSSAPNVNACLIVAVDSLLDARVLHWLDRGKRLRTAEQTNGVIPGEAAGVALVASYPFGGSQFAVRGLGFGLETATILNDEPLLGYGMTEAVRQALLDAGLEMHDVDFRLSDVAGESYAFEELVLAQTRLTRRPKESQEIWHPAASIGDCGAVAGLAQLAWAEQAFVRDYAPGAVALAHGSAAAGRRAAAVLSI